MYSQFCLLWSLSLLPGSRAEHSRDINFFIVVVFFSHHLRTYFGRDVIFIVVVVFVVVIDVVPNHEYENKTMHTGLLLSKTRI